MFKTREVNFTKLRQADHVNSYNRAEFERKNEVNRVMFVVRTCEMGAELFCD